MTSLNKSKKPLGLVFLLATESGAGKKKNINPTFGSACAAQSSETSTYPSTGRLDVGVSRPKAFASTGPVFRADYCQFGKKFEHRSRLV